MTRRSRSTFNLAPNNRKKSDGRATHASYSLVDGDHRGDVVFSARRPLAVALKRIQSYSPRPFPPPFSRRLRGGKPQREFNTHYWWLRTDLYGQARGADPRFTCCQRRRLPQDSPALSPSLLVMKPRPTASRSPRSADTLFFASLPMRRSVIHGFSLPFVCK